VCINCARHFSRAAGEKKRVNKDDDAVMRTNQIAICTKKICASAFRTEFLRENEIRFTAASKVFSS
jgi:hypothetical protein